MELNPGDTLLNGQYRILRSLGRGGFGFVYHAQDTHIGEQVAIKELIPGLVGDEETIKRFLAEARATMRLTHKRIVRTHHVFPERSNYYIVMEYMAGGSLEERLRQEGALPVEEAVRIAADVCEGLACAHEEGVVHCDLKPANILFDARGSAKVADFGIAHVSGEMLTRSWMTPAGFVAGTLPYMSPEQAEGVRDEPRIDIYALGAVLYRMLSGRTYLEFDQRETPGAQADNVHRIRNQQPQPPSAHDPRLPLWLDDAVLRALAKRPEERYAGAEAMRAALLQQPAPATAQPSPSPVKLASVQLAAGSALASRPAASVRPVAKSPSSLPIWFWPAVGAAGVLLVFLILAIAALSKGRDEPVAREGIPTSQVPAAGATQTRLEDGMVMVYVPAEAFEMGTNEGDNDEKPVHTVTLDAYWIDQTEVTNAQFRKCVEAGACEAPSNSSSPTRDSYYSNGTYDGYPVTLVDWHQAQTYCRWVGGRLPTEAEWEKAARATDGRIYPWGDQDPDCNRANYGGTTGCVGDTNQVGSYATGASPYGALDMSGNVWEWVNDWYDGHYYSISPSENPQGPETGAYKVLRGGSWYSGRSSVRTAYRSYGDPMLRGSRVGFRCAASPGE